MDVVTSSVQMSKVGEQELDLVDLIGFIWRSRVWLLCGLIIGAGLMGAGFYLRTNDLTGPTKLELGTKWMVRYPLETSSSEPPRAPPLALSNYLKTTAAAKEFYENLNRKLGSQRFPVTEWATRQIEGNAIVVSVDLLKSDLVVEVDSAAALSDREIRDALGYSLNKSIENYNMQFGSPAEQLRKRAQEALLELGEKKLKAIQLFDKYNRFSVDLHRTLLVGFTKDLTERNSLDVMALLLSNVPQTEPDKLSLLREYQQAIKKLETIREAENVLVIKSGVKDILPIASLGTEIDVQAAEPSQLNAESQPLLKRPSVGAVLGGFIGVSIALTLRILFSFLSVHRERLRKIIRD
jgi:hypothetical protein